MTAQPHSATLSGPRRDTSVVAADPTLQALWQRIQAHPFERPDQGLDLLRRLAREQGWTLTQARAAIEEYRRFCFLACVSTTPLTPSEAVDQVWHLHLTHTRDYWQRWCGEVLRQPLHHEPTRGGAAQGQAFHDQYATTLALYEQHFGLPPAHWWPAARARFAAPARWRWIDRNRYWLLPRPRLHRSHALAAACALIAALPLAAQALPANPLDWAAGPFLALYGAGLALLLVLALWLRLMARDTGAAAPGGELSARELALLCGGRERLMDTAVSAALADEALHWDAAAQRLQAGHAASSDAAAHADVVALVARHGEPARLLRHFGPLQQPLERALIGRGLLLDAAQVWRVRWWSSLPLLLWTLFGVVRIGLGLERERPIGFIVLLTLLAGVLALIMLARRPRATRAGDRVLQQARLRHARLLRAPRHQGGELALAVALGGTVALSGTAWAAYHQFRAPASSGDSGGGGDSDGGGGGGGCGGCGGD